jgi:hypothetical protein
MLLLWFEIAGTVDGPAGMYEKHNKTIDMAHLKDITFIGGLGTVTAYTMKGSDKIILRRKAGPSRAKMMHDPKYDLQRRYGKELGGCSVLGKAIRIMFGPHRNLSDQNLCPKLNQYLLQVQRRDTISELGKRSIILSQIPQMLAGFSLNKKISVFDSTIRSAITGTIGRDDFSASIVVPELLPGINFFPLEDQPMYSVTAVLGIVPDAAYDERLGKYLVSSWFDSSYAPVMTSTPWLPSGVRAEGVTLAVAVPQRPSTTEFSLMLSVGIRYGMFLGDGTVLQAKRVGAAKVLAMK